MSQNEPVRLLRIGISEFTRTFDVDGRSSRLQFWTFVVINIGLSQALASGILYIFFALNTPVEQGSRLDTEDVKLLFGAVFAVYAVTLPPYFAALVRRLHDIGKSGLWAMPHLLFIAAGLLLMAVTVFSGEDNSGLGRFLFVVVPCHFAYSIVMLILTVRPSDQSTNKWGHYSIPA